MSSRRLVSRGRANQDSSPAQHPRHRESGAAQELTPLPPYEPPSCALTPAAKCALETLSASHDYSKYKRHLDGSIKAITNSIGDSNERLKLRKEDVAKAANRRRQAEEGEEKSEEDIAREQYADGMEKKVEALTTKAEMSLRDLIDYGDELAMRDTMMKEVSENIAAAPAPRPAARRQRRQGSNEDEDSENEEEVEEDEELEVDGCIVSAVELLKKAQREYAATYASKSLRSRYDTNDYRGFKKTVHISLHGNDVPVPHARTWFPEDNQNGAANSRGGSNENESDDDEIVIARATTNLKCPLTLQVFKEPYANGKCNHVFEKEAILEYLDRDGTVFVQPSQTRGQRHAVGQKQVACPQVGCEVMLKLDDFHIDTVLLRQVKQAARQAAREEDEDDDESAPRGTQRNRPAEVDEEVDSVDIKEDRQKSIARIKRERQQSRGLSIAPDQAS